MAEFGCESCPNKRVNDNCATLCYTPDMAVITIGEDNISLSYSLSEEGHGHVFIKKENVPEVYDNIDACSGPILPGRLAGALGKPPTCAVLKELVGKPYDAQAVSEYLKTIPDKIA